MKERFQGALVGAAIAASCFALGRAVTPAPVPELPHIDAGPPKPQTDTPTCLELCEGDRQCAGRKELEASRRAPGTPPACR